MQETWVGSLGWEEPLEEGMATHSSIPVWRIPMDRGTWQAKVHGVAKRWTRLRDSAHRQWVSSGISVVSIYIFLTRLMTLCIFSCAYWSFVYLWRNVYLLLIFKLDLFLLFEVFFNYCFFISLIFN